MEQTRTIAIIEPERVLEIWDWRLMHPTDRKEREQDLGKIVETRDGERGPERRDVFQFERATQQWGHYAIQRYEARKIPMRPPYRGLALVLGAIVLFVLAAMGFPGRVPQILLIIGLTLLIAGCVLIIIAARSIPIIAPDYHVVELESLGVSGRLLGLSADARAATAIPFGHMRGPLKSGLELDAPMEEWQTEVRTVNGEWFVCSDPQS